MRREAERPRIAAYQGGIMKLAVAHRDNPREPIQSWPFGRHADALYWFADHLRGREFQGVDQNSLNTTLNELISWVQREAADEALAGHIDAFRLGNGSVITVGEKDSTRVFVAIDLAAHSENESWHRLLLTARALCDLDSRNMRPGTASIRGQLKEEVAQLRSPNDALAYVAAELEGQLTDHLGRVYRVTVTEKGKRRPQPKRASKPPARKRPPLRAKRTILA